MILLADNKGPDQTACMPIGMARPICRVLLPVFCQVQKCTPLHKGEEIHMQGEVTPFTTLLNGASLQGNSLVSKGNNFLEKFLLLEVIPLSE